MTRLVRILVLALLLASAAAAPAAADLNDKLGALTGDNARGYLGPLPKALSATINSAVFQSGKVPRTGVEFSIGIHVMGASFGDKDRTFTPTDPPGFQSTTPTPVPTIIGGSESVAVPGQGGTALNYPGGLDTKSFTFGAPQLTIGSVFGTRAVVRWISLKLGDSDLGKLQLFGIGGQHSISQYVPGLPADVAVGVFYQTFKIGDGILDTKAFHADVTASRMLGGHGLAKLEPYVGLGFDTFKMDVSYTSTTDPGDHIGISMDNQTNVHFTLGAQLLLPGVKLHGEFNAAANTGAAIGLSFGR
jgi:hypothetical protein